MTNRQISRWWNPLPVGRLFHLFGRRQDTPYKCDAILFRKGRFARQSHFLASAWLRTLCFRTVCSMYPKWIFLNKSSIKQYNCIIHCILYVAWYIMQYDLHETALHRASNLAINLKMIFVITIGHWRLFDPILTGIFEKIIARFYFVRNWKFN